MISATISLRVRYGETDQMGVVYHGNYPAYFEVARVEFFRSIGLPYKELEDKGIILPVIDLQIKFIGSAYYDEVLVIKAILREIPQGVRLRFDYEIYNENEKLLTTGHTILAFVDSKTRKPIRCPQYLIDKINNIVINQN